MNIKFIFFIFLFLQSIVLSSHDVTIIELNDAYCYNDNPKEEVKKREISVNLEAVLMVSNNHVGDDWQHFLSIDDQVIFKGESLNLTLQSRAPLRVEAHSIEADKDYPDAGENHMDFIYSDLIAIEKNRFEMDVTIVENGGQYAGNIAIAKFLFVIKQI